MGIGTARWKSTSITTTTRRPHFASVRSRLLEREFRYRRLVMPFTSDGLRWDKLLVAIEAA